ncbi:Panacea domain-containing protein [Listeria costaricensis]|uniref:Panacea domain-containing protein n=1 Tax=Listeria costaricensis TaxID=2026604 RepID=UPI0013C4EF9F|nr:type II toxin-antitoxin system antitoxin SocA domain-containing protein [Listeria costaricensis]
MGAPYNAIDVANYIIEKDTKPTNLRVQKLLYFAFGEKLAASNKCLFHEDIEKWRLGPVIPEVYHNFKDYGSEEISPQQRVFLNEEGRVQRERFDESVIEEEDRKFIDRIIACFKEKSDFELVEETHKHPMWQQFSDDINGGIRHLRYTNKEIKKYFQENSYL